MTIPRRTNTEEVIFLVKNRELKKLGELGFFTVEYWLRRDKVVRVHGMKSDINIDTSDFIYDGTQHWCFEKENTEIILSE